MKPILYESTDEQFNHNGIGTLADAISCTVIEERNGSYELEMEYPLGGIHYEEIKNNNIVLAVPSDGKRAQPFRIYKITRPLNGVVRIYAQHISYDLGGIPVAPFKAGDCASALNGLKTNSMISNPFDVWTDISGSGKYNQKIPATFRSRLAGTKGSILDSFGNGAELEFDRFTVKVHQNRGHDNGVAIRYGKNLTDLKQDESIESVYTGVIAYWSKEENDKQEVLIGDIQYLSNHADYPKERVYVLDCSTEYDKKPDKGQLNNRASQYIRNNNVGIPKVTIDVSFIQLWQTEEYKNIVSLERVSLCDTVHVVFDKLGVNATAKVIKTEYNVLTDRYDKVTLGEARSNFADAIKESTKATIQPVIKSALESAIEHATANISGFSGYITKVTDGNGNWSELVISDHADYTQARNVWRWSQGGLGFSSNGYAGPYTTAITADGQINGAMITAGTINASTINVGNKLLTETLMDLTNTTKTSIKGTKQYYLQTTSNEKPSKDDSGWSTDKAYTIEGQHLWYMLADVTASGAEIRHEPFELTGTKGADGRGIVGTPKVTYQASKSATEVPTGAWTTTVPVVTDGWTVWTKQTYTYSDNTTSDVYSPSVTGKAGKGVKQVNAEYYLSTSEIEQTGGSWTVTRPEKNDGTYIWSRYKTIYTDLTESVSEPFKDDVLNGIADVLSTTKSSLEQLDGSIRAIVEESSSMQEEINNIKSQSQSYATKAELAIEKDSITQSLTNVIDGKTSVLKQIKLLPDGMHIQGAEGSTTEQVFDEKSYKIVTNDKTMIEINTTEARVNDLRAEGNVQVCAHKFKRGRMNEITGKSVSCTNLFWLGGSEDE